MTRRPQLDWYWIGTASLAAMALAGCGGSGTRSARRSATLTEDDVIGRPALLQDSVVTHLEAPSGYAPRGDTGSTGVDTWEVIIDESETLSLAIADMPDAEFGLLADDASMIASVRSGDPPRSVSVGQGRYRIRLTNLGDQSRYARVTWTEGSSPGLVVAVAKAAWPQYHGNAALTGLGTGSGAQGRLKWRFKTGGAVHAAPVVGPDGTVYVASTDGQFYAINSLGAKKWSTSLPPANAKTAVAAAIAEDGTIYAGSGEGGVVALHPDGMTKWTFSCGAVNGGITLGPDGELYFGSADKYLRAVTPEGTMRWAYATQGDMPGCPALGDDGAVYVSSLDGNGYAVNANGSERWIDAGGGQPYASPVILPNARLLWVSGDSIYNEDVYSTVFEDWFETCGYAIWTTPAVDRAGNVGFVAVGPDGYSGGGTAVDLYSVSFPTMNQTWTTVIGGTGEPSTSAPAVDSAGVFYVGTTSGNLVAVDTNGSLKWSFATQGAIWSSPAIGADGTVYVGSSDGYVYAIK